MESLSQTQRNVAGRNDRQKRTRVAEIVAPSCGNMHARRLVIRETSTCFVPNPDPLPSLIRKTNLEAIAVASLTMPAHEKLRSPGVDA